MKSIYLTLFLLASINLASAQNFEWLNTAGGSNQGWDLESTIDNNDNVIIGGSFTTDTMFVANDTIVNDWAPNPGGFLIKMGSDGTTQWSKAFNGAQFIYVNGIDTDGFGNIYVTGSFGSSESWIDFGNGVSVSTLDDEAFYVVKFNPAGLAMWAKTGELKDWASGQGFSGRSIIADNLGNSYVGLDFSGDTLIVDGQFEIANPVYPTDNAIILKLAPNGTLINSFSTGMDTHEGSRMAFAPNGSIVFTTQFNNPSVIVGTDNLINPNSGTKHGAIINLTPNLVVMWARSFGSESDDEFMDVAVDNLGNIYVAGLIQGTLMQFGSTTINNIAPALGVIAKFDSQGNKQGVITTTSSTGNGLSAFTSVDIVNHNEIYVTCLYDFEETFIGDSSLPAPGFFNSFVARIDSSGKALWMYNSEAAAPVPTDSIIWNNLHHDQDGNIYINGWYKAGDIGFAGGVFANNTLTGPYDLLATKLSNACNLGLNFENFDATCGQNNGSSTVFPSGGSGNYSYQWTSGDSTNAASALTSGIYQVVATDLSTGCDVSGIAMISDVGGATINIVGAGTNNITCPEGNNGQVLINLVGGQAPRTISWSTGDTTLLINNLSAGPYDVTVEDANGCITTRSIELTQPSSFELSYTTTDASCGVLDGTADVTVLGGTPIYTYLWSTGGTSNTESALGVGDYEFFVTDGNGCVDSTLVMISEEDGPIITVDSTITASCLDGNGGSVFISISGQSGPYSYQWSNGGGTNEDLVNVSPGTYAVMVTAGNGCSSMLSGEVLKQLPNVQAVCLVTVDTTSGYNLVVWEKEAVDYLSHYNIYQEQTQAGVYNLVGSTEYDSLSQFVDSLASPNIRSYRYKIGAVDTCGIESELSWEHKTIHLVKSSFGGDNYLSWDSYEGFTYPSFIVWRYTDQLGWVNIYTLPSTINSFTDVAPVGTNIDYMIEAVPNEPCTSTKAQDHNTTRSNRHTIIAPNTNGIEEPINTFVSLYPNPTNDLFTIDLSKVNPNRWSVEVYDVSGKTVSFDQNLKTNMHIIDLSKAESGIYLVRVQIGNDMIFQKVVKQ